MRFLVILEWISGRRSIYVASARTEAEAIAIPKAWNPGRSADIAASSALAWHEDRQARIGDSVKPFRAPGYGKAYAIRSPEWAEAALASARTEAEPAGPIAASAGKGPLAA